MIDCPYCAENAAKLVGFDREQAIALIDAAIDEYQRQQLRELDDALHEMDGNVMTTALKIVSLTWVMVFLISTIWISRLPTRTNRTVECRVSR